MFMFIIGKKESKMKIPNTDIYCQFKFQHYIKRTSIENVRTVDGDHFAVRVKHHAKAVDEVPYWRLYTIKLMPSDGPYKKTERKIISKSIYNHTFEDICKIVEQLGKLTQIPKQKIRYFYEAWPRHTQFNRK